MQARKNRSYAIDFLRFMECPLRFMERTTVSLYQADFFPPEGAFPVLSGRLQRSDVERVLVQVGHALGLPDTRLKALLAMIQRTAPSDWTDPSREPVCYEEQQQIAAALGKTPRALRADEAALERAGLLVKTSGADGSRGSFAGGRIRQGICFSPLIARMTQLMDLADRLRAQSQERQSLRRQVSASRRILKSALGSMAELSATDTATYELVEGWSLLPRRYDGLTASELSALLSRVDDLTHKVLSYIEKRGETSGVTESGCRRSIQDTKEETSVSCNGASVFNRPSGKPDDAMRSDADDPIGPASCHEQKDRPGDRGHKPELLESFRPRKIYAAVSENMRLYLDAVKGTRGLPNQLDFIRAAELMLPELGVSTSAWSEACNVLGDLAAALSVCVIDAGQYREISPIHSPGGALRAFTRRARVGQLNLTGSLIGMIERSRLR
ncbi:replication initiation protein RepC [Phaeovulum sp. W22_SRMD_FR3]